jgi:glycerophosphoryl diester phosphodiesterase
MLATPIVIGHRGACGYRPEHTLASYELAAEMGADYLEPDLVCTADGVLVCRHEPEIADTTDVLERFPDREPIVWEFTLDELKRLRARERLPELRPDNTAYDGQFEVPTFAELLSLAARVGKGVYPETKHPDRHAAVGLELEPLLAEALTGFTGPVFLQSFSADSLRAMAGFGHPLVQLVGRDPVDFAEVAAYADAIGPPKQRVDAEYVAAAHAAGLAVHPFTFRRENQFLPADLRSSDDPAAVGDWRAEYERFAALGVDGVFTDNPDLAVAALG